MVRKIKQTDNAMGNAEKTKWHCVVILMGNLYRAFQHTVLVSS